MPGLWDWSPGDSVGPFRFGDPAEEIIEFYELRKKAPDCSIATWESYEIPGWESFISVEDEKVSGVCCWDSCLFEGNELLGISMTDARELLGQEDGLGEGLGSGYAAYYHRLGLTLFVEEGGIVESATCEMPIIDDSMESSHPKSEGP